MFFVGETRKEHNGTQQNADRNNKELSTPSTRPQPTKAFPDGAAKKWLVDGVDAAGKRRHGRWGRNEQETGTGATATTTGNRPSTCHEQQEALGAATVSKNDRCRL